jgi:prophage regulatory protein
MNTAIACAGTTTPNRFMQLPEVIHLTGLSKSTIYAQMLTHSFPKHIPLGARRVGWLESEIQAWIAARIASARGGVAM